jgi:hypothetical protein
MFTDPVVDRRPWTSVEGRVAVFVTVRLLTNVDTDTSWAWAVRGPRTVRLPNVLVLPIVVFPATMKLPNVFVFPIVVVPTTVRLPRVLNVDTLVRLVAVRKP